MKNFAKISGLILGAVVLFVVYSNYKKLVIISGFSAKNTASAIFIADRNQASVEGLDNNFSPVNWADNEVDFIQKTVTSNVLGLKPRSAIYREGLGVAVTTVSQDNIIDLPVPLRTNSPDSLTFPYGSLPQKDTVFKEVDYEKLNMVVEGYMGQNTPTNTTRALLVIYKNQILAEEYVGDVTQDTKLLGWSMTKSLMSTVFGVMETQGLIHHNDKAPIEEWEHDERAQITISNLLQMNSGLAWEEDYTKISDATNMLYYDTDMTIRPKNKRLESKPNNSWNYSSGTSNILSGIIRSQFSTHQEYLDYWYTDLIDRIGMESMLVETDLVGNFVASSYAWATVRDWAKLGLLYLNNGDWNGDRVLSKAWIDYAKTPTNTSEGIYGAQFWLNSGGHLPDVPKDMYMATGYQGQRIFIIPSKELVVVRMGVSYGNVKNLQKERTLKEGERQEIVNFELKNKNSNKLLKEIIGAID